MFPPEERYAVVPVTSKMGGPFRGVEKEKVTAEGTVLIAVAENVAV